MLQKDIPLLTLAPDTDVDALVSQIIRTEPLISENRRPQLLKLVYKLCARFPPLDARRLTARAWSGRRALCHQHCCQPRPRLLRPAADRVLARRPLTRARSLAARRIDKIDTAELPQNFYLFKILRAHILPLTNCAFNKSGDRFITGSYDRTCKVWNTLTGEELLTLEGHKNVVYAIAFNNPFGDKVVTGSFDKTAKIWDSSTGELLQTLRGHTTEIVCLSFDPSGEVVATGSMDSTAKLWDVARGTELCTLMGHTAEIVSLNFNTPGTMIITGSFDHTTKVVARPPATRAATLQDALPGGRGGGLTPRPNPRPCPVPHNLTPHTPNLTHHPHPSPFTPHSSRLARAGVGLPYGRVPADARGPPRRDLFHAVRLQRRAVHLRLDRPHVQDLERALGRMPAHAARPQ